MLKRILSVSLLLVGSTAFAAPKAALSDAEIAKIVMTINKAEVEAARVAKGKAQNSDVKNFAEDMMREHGKNFEKTQELAKNINVNPTESNISQTLSADAKDTENILKNSDKQTFDSTYIDSQIAMHQKALATIENSLLPNADNPRLRNHLRQTQNAVSMHLDHAKQLRKKLK